jgi:hypothetical protein
MVVASVTTALALFIFCPSRLLLGSVNLGSLQTN